MPKKDKKESSSLTADALASLGPVKKDSAFVGKDSGASGNLTVVGSSNNLRKLAENEQKKTSAVKGPPEKPAETKQEKTQKKTSPSLFSEVIQKRQEEQKAQQQELVKQKKQGEQEASIEPPIAPHRRTPG